MSNSTDTTGCLSHRPNTRFFITFEDFLDIASVSRHKKKLAAFWRVLETKTNDRITYNKELVEDAKKKGLEPPETTLWIEISYSAMVSRSLETFESSSFQIAAAESERLGFSQSRALKRKKDPHDPDSPMEDYKEYLFLTDVMQSVMNGGEYPPPIENNSPLLKTRKRKKKDETPIENNTPPIENNTPPLLKTTGGAIENKRIKYNKESSKDNRRIEESNSADVQQPAVSQDAIAPATHTSSSPSEENGAPPDKLSPNETSSQQDIHQASSDIPIAEGTTPPSDGDVMQELHENTGQPEQTVRGKKAAPPTMPTGAATWSPETMLQVFEARRGRRYPNGARRKSDRIRDKELEACKSLYDMDDLWSEGGDTAQQVNLLDLIIHQQETRKNKWWLETNGPVMPHQLVDKDRVHTMYDELVRLGKVRAPAPPPSSEAPASPTTSTEPPPPVLIGVSGLPVRQCSGPLPVLPPKRDSHRRRA